MSAGPRLGRRDALASAAWASGLVLGARETRAARPPGGAAPQHAVLQLAVWTRYDQRTGRATVSLAALKQGGAHAVMAETTLDATQATSLAATQALARQFAAARLAKAWAVDVSDCHSHGAEIVAPGHSARLVQWVDFI